MTGISIQRPAEWPVPADPPDDDDNGNTGCTCSPVTPQQGNIDDWESEELLKRHLVSDHMRAYMLATEDLIEETGIHHLKKIR